MCVIFCCNEKVPSQPLLELADQEHPDGIGVAWGNKKGDGVIFRKGLELKDLLALLPTVQGKSPVIHFRRASIGDKVPQLTHPFPLIPGAPPEMLEGEVPGVLFQNGTWHAWTRKLTEIVFASGEMLHYMPSEPRSDAWALAWIVAKHGEFVLKELTFSEQMRILTWWPFPGRGNSGRILWGTWISQDPDTKERLGWSQSQELFLPRPKKGKEVGVETRAVGFLPQSSVKEKRNNLYYDEVEEKWLPKEKWFQNFRMREAGGTGSSTSSIEGDETPAAWLKEGDVVEAEIITGNGTGVYTEEELVTMAMQLRALREGGESGDSA